MTNDIEIKYRELIDKAKNYMMMIDDHEHDINHMEDVVNYTYELLDLLKINLDKDACIIAAYWHDVGRIKCVDGHEKISAQMLREEMLNLNYEDKLIDNCCNAIETHKWNMTPNTKEGLVLKDADKLAWLGKGRWKSCLENNQSLDSIISLLPKLRTEILYFEESRNLYDRDIVKLFETLYNYKK